MNKKISILTYCGLLLALSASTGYADKPGLFDKLPVTYIGRFQWNNSANMQQVVFIWENESKDEKGELILTGKGEYGIKKKINTIIRGIVDPETYKIEIWEDAGKTENVTTDGSHIGSISSDLKTISTVWTTVDGKGREVNGLLKLIRK